MFRTIVLITVCLTPFVLQIQANYLTTGISNFASDLYQQCVKSSESSNVFISPFSIANLLALLSDGSNGNTFDILRKGLHLSGNHEFIANQFNETYNLIQKGAGRSSFFVANKIYVQNGYPIKARFVDVAHQQFHSDVERIDFINNNLAAQTINQYVEQKTNKKIKKFIEPNVLDYDSRLVLINAVYFKGIWEHPFDVKMTTKGEFYISETEGVPVEFMHIENDFNYVYLEHLDASALQMKYEKSNFSFVAVLPNSRTGLSALESQLQKYNLAEITDRMIKMNTDVWIPKFKISFEVSLNDILKKMGMEEIFSDNADFSGLLSTQEHYKVSNVIHKTFIELNEHGSEAAAASGVQITTYSFPPIFRAEHPFFYYIWDDNSKMPIFSGRIINFKSNPKIHVPPKFEEPKERRPLWKIFISIFVN